MVLVSGPPYGYTYPPAVDGTTQVKYNGRRIPNLFDIKRQLFERDNANFRSLSFYRSTSKELLSQFSDAQILGEDLEVQPVSISYSNYERAIAKLFKTRNLTLPMMTLAIADTAQAPDRRRPNYNVELWTIKDERKRRYTRVASLAPIAVNVTYQLHLWSRYVEDMNQLLEYVMQKFRPHLRVETNFNTDARAFITAVSDNSTLAVPNREDRIIRKTITFDVQTYMPTRQYMIQSNGTITDMHFETTLDIGPDVAGKTLIVGESNLIGGTPPVSALEDEVVSAPSGQNFPGPDPY